MGKLIGKLKYFFLITTSVVVVLIVRHYITKKPKKLEKITKKPVKKLVKVQKPEKKTAPKLSTKKAKVIVKSVEPAKRILTKKSVSKKKKKKVVKKRAISPSVSASSPTLAPAPAPPFKKKVVRKLIKKPEEAKKKFAEKEVVKKLPTVKKPLVKKQLITPKEVTPQEVKPKIIAKPKPKPVKKKPPKKVVKKAAKKTEKIVKKAKVKRPLKVFIKKIVIKGNTVIPTYVLYKAVKRYEGKDLSLKDMRDIVKILTKIYFDRGYVTSWAYLPPQNLSTHILYVKIFEGKVGRVTFVGESKYYSRNYLLSYVQNLRSGKVFNQNVLERDLLNLNDNMNLKVTASLKRGEDPGTTDIYFKLTNSTFPFAMQISYDNSGSKYTSKDRYGLSWSLGNFPFYGSIFNFAGIMGSSYNRLHSYSLTFETPIGKNGLRGGVWFSQGDSNLGRELAVLNVKSYSTFLGFFVSYPVVYLINKKIVLQSSLNFLKSKQSMLSKVTGEVKYSYAQISLKVYKTTVTSENLFTVTLTQGLGNLLGKTTNITLATRSNATSTFSKINLDFTRVQRFNDSLFFILKLKGQYTEETLYASQNFYIGGPASVRGFLLTQYGGDIGYTASGELRWAPLKDKTTFQFLTFVDTGSVYLNNPAPGEAKHHSLTGAGFGIRLNLPKDLHWLVDVGYPIHPNKDGEKKSVNFYVKIYKKF